MTAKEYNRKVKEWFDKGLKPIAVNFDRKENKWNIIITKMSKEQLESLQNSKNKIFVEKLEAKMNKINEDKLEEIQLKTEIDLHQFSHLQNDIDTLTDKCIDIVISTSENLSYAKDLAKQAREISKWIEDKRKEVTKPLLDKKKELDTFAKDLISGLNDSTADLRGQILNYEMKLEAERQVELERIEAEKQAEIEKLEKIESPVLKQELITEIENKKTGEITHLEKSTSLRKTWTFKIENENHIPREYLIPDERKIKQAIKEGIREIQGLVIFEKTSLNLR